MRVVTTVITIFAKTEKKNLNNYNNNHGQKVSNSSNDITNGKNNLQSYYIS